jgi:SAM-dependent methyltransferase
VSPDLSLFAEATFDFVYTTLVLQHMPPSLSTLYIRELVRVLAPGGLLVFQLPSQRSTAQPPADAHRTAIEGPLPDTALLARLALSETSLSVDPGKPLPLHVIVENNSLSWWPCMADARGKHQIKVANRWRQTDGAFVQRDDGRCPIEFDLAPGARTNVMLVATAPPLDGTYLLELDVVQEDVAWFAERGSESLRVPVVVGTGVTPAPPEPQPTFRGRHPQVYKLLRATGLRDAYWVWRRALDGVRMARDAVVITVQQRRAVRRLVRWWESRPFAPVMEMHWVPRAEVVDLVVRAGGHVVEVEEERTPGYLSCKYWVVKREN